MIPHQGKNDHVHKKRTKWVYWHLQHASRINFIYFVSLAAMPKSTIGERCFKQYKGLSKRCLSTAGRLCSVAIASLKWSTKISLWVKAREGKAWVADRERGQNMFSHLTRAWDAAVPVPASKVGLQLQIWPQRSRLIFQDWDQVKTWPWNIAKVLNVSTK